MKLDRDILESGIRNAITESLPQAVDSNALKVQLAAPLALALVALSQEVPTLGGDQAKIREVVVDRLSSSLSRGIAEYLKGDFSRKAAKKISPGIADAVSVFVRGFAEEDGGSLFDIVPIPTPGQ